MNCRQAREAFSSRIDNELGGQDEQRLRVHLDGCPECSARWKSFEVTVRMVRGLPQISPAPDFVGQVLDRVRAFEAGRRELAPLARRPWYARLQDFLDRGSWGRWAPAVRFAGAAGLGVVVGLLVGHQGLLPWEQETNSPPISATSTASLSSEAGTESGRQIGDRPFEDLVGRIPPVSAGASARDSLSTTSGGAPGIRFDESATAGRQVGLVDRNARPQIIF